MEKASSLSIQEARPNGCRLAPLAFSIVAVAMLVKNADKVSSPNSSKLGYIVARF